jgi:hypothetical protein
LDTSKGVDIARLLANIREIENSTSTFDETPVTDSPQSVYINLKTEIDVHDINKRRPLEDLMGILEKLKES